MSTAIAMTARGSNGALDLGVVPSGAVQMASVRTRLHLTRRGRVVFTTLAAIPVAAVALALALNGGIAAAEGANAGAATVADVATVFDYVTIASGQSLWQLAETIAPTSDPRDVIAEIVSLNQLPSENVQPGQRLALPARF
ncbi:LysM repeat protein [Cryobacterium sp. MP_M5]|uniref:LysM peptidoglycan-binding domain-containing protein n=1 Tax=unclassified Cryobacterium TaxID=2649013 RepID=UPI001A3121E1|nr:MULTISPECIES: LysM peptidoglycan-binding domain-containing protein [unclassified Cryobacterium]MBG6057468.1 LysM repeat protein [Cryobacterium sp. MP_M3]MEC5175667.1 LysM repeat protein [Cryobacterium sp. MP_M5]